jgi:hypothetical protein
MPRPFAPVNPIPRIRLKKAQMSSRKDESVACSGGLPDRRNLWKSVTVCGTERPVLNAAGSVGRIRAVENEFRGMGVRIMNNGDTNQSKPKQNNSKATSRLASEDERKVWGEEFKQATEKEGYVEVLKLFHEFHDYSRCASGSIVTLIYQWGVELEGGVKLEGYDFVLSVAEAGVKERNFEFSWVLDVFFSEGDEIDSSHPYLFTVDQFLKALRLRGQELRYKKQEKDLRHLFCHSISLFQKKGDYITVGKIRQFKAEFGLSDEKPEELPGQCDTKWVTQVLEVSIPQLKKIRQRLSEKKSVHLKFLKGKPIHNVKLALELLESEFYPPARLKRHIKEEDISRKREILDLTLERLRKSYSDQAQRALRKGKED